MHHIVEIPAKSSMPSDDTVYGQAHTPVGVAWLSWDAVGLRQFAFGAMPVEFNGWLSNGHFSARRDDATATGLSQAAFTQNDLGMPLVLCGTEFQREVWRALLQIEWGQTLSYGALAARLGKPAAARAVGSAVGANRLGFCVPCHRVVRQDGVSGEFRWGRAVKARLLDWETRLGHG